MGTLASLPAHASATYDARALALIKRTVAADCNDDEFDLFIHTARHLRLDPLRRQIYAFVFSKNDPKKRRMSIIVAIDGFRAIAERTGNYRPDDEEPSYEVDASLKGPLNPVGLVKASVRVWKFSHGEWHRVTASAHWDEYAPIKDEWGEGDDGRRRPTGRQTLDTSGNWGKMPRLMLAKVAEALALRKAWPDDLANVYANEEVDRVRAADLLPSEAAAEGASDERMEKVRAKDTILIQWQDNTPVVPVPVGQFADKVMAFIKENPEEPGAIAVWQERNRFALREFWAKSPGDALAVKAALEKATAPALTQAAE
jgi:phage recombination protein Bet